MIRHPHRAALAAALLLAAGCVAEPAEPLPPANLEERQARLDEVRAQLEVLEEADGGQASGMLTHDDYRVRRLAARRLEALGEDAADEVPALVDALEDDHHLVRVAAAAALSAIGDERAIEPLLPLVVDSHAKVRLWAAKAIRSFGEPGIAALIENMATDAPFTTLAYLDLAGKQVTLRQEAKAILARSGEEALPLLIEALGTDDRNIAINITGVLGRMGEDAEEALPAMLAALETDDAHLRANLIADIAKVGDLHPDVMPTLQGYKKDKDKKVSRAARKAIKKLEKDAKKKKPAARKRGGVTPPKGTGTPRSGARTPRQQAAAGETPATPGTAEKR